MTPENKKDITYRRQRYKSRERQLQITPDTETLELEVEGPAMGENLNDRVSKEEEFSQHLLKAIHDLSRGNDEVRQQNNSNNKGKGVQGDVHLGEGLGTSHHQATNPTNVPHVFSTPPRSTIPTFLASGAGGL